MMEYEPDFINSSYCNIHLIDKEAFPNSIKIIYNQWKMNDNKQNNQDKIQKPSLRLKYHDNYDTKISKQLRRDILATLQNLSPNLTEDMKNNNPVRTNFTTRDKANISPNIINNPKHSPEKSIKNQNERFDQTINFNKLRSSPNRNQNQNSNDFEHESRPFKTPLPDNNILYDTKNTQYNDLSTQPTHYTPVKKIIKLLSDTPNNTNEPSYFLSRNPSTINNNNNNNVYNPKTFGDKIEEYRQIYNNIHRLESGKIIPKQNEVSSVTPTKHKEVENPPPYHYKESNHSFENSSRNQAHNENKTINKSRLYGVFNSKHDNSSINASLGSNITDHNNQFLIDNESTNMNHKDQNHNLSYDNNQTGIELKGQSLFLYNQNQLSRKLDKLMTLTNDNRGYSSKRNDGHNNIEYKNNLRKYSHKSINQQTLNDSIISNIRNQSNNISIKPSESNYFIKAWDKSIEDDSTLRNLELKKFRNSTLTPISNAESSYLTNQNRSISKTSINRKISLSPNTKKYLIPSTRLKSKSRSRSKSRSIDDNNNKLNKHKNYTPKLYTREPKVIFKRKIEKISTIKQAQEHYQNYINQERKLPQNLLPIKMNNQEELKKSQNRTLESYTPNRKNKAPYLASAKLVPMTIQDHPHQDLSMYEDSSQKMMNLLREIDQLEQANREQGIKKFIDENRISNVIFMKLSHVTAWEFLQTCDIITLCNKTLYQEDEKNPNAYIILYGRVFLKNAKVGIFKECIMGDTLAEEAILEFNFTKQETAKIIEDTGLLEISQPNLSTVKARLEKGYQSDYFLFLSLLRKNLIQKKSLRAISS